MFITKKHISRRTVLRGIGATVAVPLLDAMVPAGTAFAKTRAASKVRFAAIEMVHGSAGSRIGILNSLCRRIERIPRSSFKTRCKSSLCLLLHVISRCFLKSYSTIKVPVMFAWPLRRQI